MVILCMCVLKNVRLLGHSITWRWLL